MNDYRGRRELEPFRRYLDARYEAWKREQTFRVYVADSLYYSGQNKVLSIQYGELLNPKPIDRRTGDEIAEDVILSLGLRFDDECI